MNSIEWVNFHPVCTLESNTYTTRSNTEFDINPTLLPIQKNELITLLLTYSDVFAVNAKCPSMATGVKHVINTGNAQPIKQKLYPIAPSVEEEIMLQMNEMLENQICRSSNSPWASRVLLVTKRDGNKRFSVDFTELLVQIPTLCRTPRIF